MMAYNCNPNYSEGRDQETHSSRQAWEESETLSQSINQEA
jgi:hypothetical protein